jgi:hypothetical protein
MKMNYWQPKLELMERKELEELQLQRLKSVVEKVYKNVPFYEKKFKQAGITPEDIKSLKDLVKLPTTKKQDLRDNYPFGLFAVRWTKWCECMPLPALPASPPWSATQPKTSRPGLTSWPATLSWSGSRRAISSRTL